MRPALLAMALLTTLGCHATALAPEVETVGTLAPSYASIRPPAPVAKRAPVVEAVMVSRDAGDATTIEPSGNPGELPEVAAKGGGMRAGVR